MGKRQRLRKHDVVFHVDNLDVSMRVDEIKYDNNKLVEIVCRFYEGQELKKQAFHSYELIPENIKNAGADAVEAYKNC